MRALISDRGPYRKFAVRTEYVYEDMSYRIGKIEPWKSEYSYPKQGVLFVMAVDELDAYRCIQERLNKHD